MGESFASRVAASLITAMDLPELITTSALDYEAKAIQLATDPQLLSSIRDRLSKNKGTSALFNAAQFARNLEMAFEKMYDIYLSDKPTENIFIQAT